MVEENSSTPAQPVVAEAKKSGKNVGLIVFATIMTVLALGAGIFIAIDKATEGKRIDDAVSQKCASATKQEQTPASQGTPIEDNGSSSAATDCIDAPNSTTSNASDYIYIADWGVRIKKPEGYYVWYRVEPDTGSSTKGKLELSASPTNAQVWSNYGDFDDGGQLLTIYRRDGSVTEWEAGGSIPSPIGSFGGYSYFYSGPQACSAAVGDLGGDACQREQDVYNALKDNFTNLDNWSTF